VLQHPDTAAAYNNLGCCLERLGKTGQAMGFMEKAKGVLVRTLGADHPRATTVSRNINRVKCKSLQMKVPAALHMHSKVKQKRAGIASTPEEQSAAIWNVRAQADCTHFACFYRSTQGKWEGCLRLQPFSLRSRTSSTRERVVELGSHWRPNAGLGSSWGALSQA
jgi:hypothetical protein